jgi:hypothetical protein
MDQNETTKEPQLSIIGKENLLWYKYVTLDTTHVLRSALNEEAPLKAVVFERRKKER